MNKEDGTRFNEWKAEMTSGGLAMTADDGKLLMKLAKLPKDME